MLLLDIPILLGGPYHKLRARQEISQSIALSPELNMIYGENERNGSVGRAVAR
jgi:hypothetical protein